MKRHPSIVAAAASLVLGLVTSAVGQQQTSPGMWDDLVRDSSPQALPSSREEAVIEDAPAKRVSPGKPVTEVATIVEKADSSDESEGPEQSKPEEKASPTPTPSPSPAVAMDPEKPATKSMFVIDPRSELARSQFTGSPFEPTSLVVNRAVIIGGVDPKDPTGTPKWKVREPLNIPVIYNTRTLRMSEETMKRAGAVLERLAAIQKRSAELQKEAEATLKEWNEIVRAGTPEPVLYADSPSLPENQSGGEVNRGEARPGFEPGDGISFELQ